MRFCIFLLCLVTANIFSQTSLVAKRIKEKITVDAKMGESSWLTADSTTTNFITIRPVPGLESAEGTTVRLVYDDFALYFFVTCYDNPDSISNVYSVRDDYNANADVFSVFLDTYNDHQNGFYFGITSTGVQLDGKILLGDFNDQLNLVWEVRCDEPIMLGWRNCAFHTPHCDFRKKKFSHGTLILIGKSLEEERRQLGLGLIRILKIT